MMEGDIEAGMQCWTEDNFKEEGELAFEEDELVTVLKVASDPLRPAFKFVVHSNLLNRDVLLREMDLRLRFCPRCGHELDYSLKLCTNCSWTIPRGRTAYVGIDEVKPIWRST